MCLPFAHCTLCCGLCAGGIAKTMKQIVQAEGIQGLYKGMIPNYVKVVPAVSVSFLGQQTTRHNKRAAAERTRRSMAHESSRVSVRSVYEQMRKVLDL